MGVVSFTAAAYARAQKALLPPGRLWALAPDSILSLVLLATGDELARVSGRAVDIVEEADGDTTTELLTDFERELALVNTGTDAERRTRITAQETKRPAFKPADVISALAPYLDLAEVDVVLIEISNADAVTSGDETIVYRFYVYRNPALGGTPDIAAAQVELDAISHSHTKGFVIESTAFTVESATSLVSRDTI